MILATCFSFTPFITSTELKLTLLLFYVPLQLNSHLLTVVREIAGCMNAAYVPVFIEIVKEHYSLLKSGMLAQLIDSSILV
jgi:hypothetical protein